ncbi:MAG: uridine kinase [Blastocatellia bacterium]
MVTSEIVNLADEIMEMRSGLLANRAMLVGISGIDASGKGFITDKIAEVLKYQFNVAVINVDGWLNLPHIRFDPSSPAENFYENALRLDEMFARLILPLKENRTVDIEIDFAEETAVSFRPNRYAFQDIDIILLEGIFLFKRKYAGLFELKIWIDCSFKTALERAISRSQEGLSRDETIKACETIYFPAQRLHFEQDFPATTADLVFINDEPQ